MTRALPRVLAVDDDESWLEQIPVILEDQCTVECVPTIDRALKAIEIDFYDIVLLDLNFEGELRTGMEVFNKIHSLDQGIDVIVISGETDPTRLVEVFNSGVSRFIVKPASPSEIRTTVAKVIQQREAKRELSLKAGPELHGRANPLFGASPAMKRLQNDVARLLNSNVRDLLITGETGTGKELLARYFSASAGSKVNFLPIHCGAIADGVIESELFGHVKGAFTGADRDRTGVFEMAAGGFVFLDEIGEMPLSHQAKLLRVLQERTVTRVGSNIERSVNFRSISATHVDLAEAVSEKRFRDDLYYRIAGSTIAIPALRERKEDIPALALRFLQAEPSLPAQEFTEGALEMLRSYEWPGNIRQLKAVVQDLQTRVRDRVIRERDIFTVLPASNTGFMPGLRRVSSGAFANSVLVTEKKRFEKALVDANGNRDEAAKTLGLSRATYFRRAKELGLVGKRNLIQI